MSNTQAKQPGELFAGTLYISILDLTTGEFDSFFSVETDKLEIKTPSDQLTARSKSRENYGQVHTDARVPKPVEFAVTFTETTRKIMAMKLSGVLETINQASVTLSAKAIALKGFDDWIEIGAQNISETGLLVKDATGTTTYDRDVDYVLNPRLGLIRPIDGGKILANANVTFTGSTAAVGGTRIVGGKQYRHQFKAWLDGINVVTQEDAVVTIPLASVSSEDAHDFLGDKLTEVALKGQLTVPTGGKAPFWVEYPKSTT